MPTYEAASRKQLRADCRWLAACAPSFKLAHPNLRGVVDVTLGLTSERVAALRIETAALTGHLDQHLRGDKARRAISVQTLERTHQAVGA
jgi:hypothetical protein